MRLRWPFRSLFVTDPINSREASDHKDQRDLPTDGCDIHDIMASALQHAPSHTRHLWAEGQKHRHWPADAAHHPKPKPLVEPFRVVLRRDTQAERWQAELSSFVDQSLEEPFTSPMTASFLDDADRDL
jgi:hypothetical protein